MVRVVEDGQCRDGVAYRGVEAGRGCFALESKGVYCCRTE